MLHNRKSDEWEVFNNPPRHPVKYYSILKKKREFSQLIRQYDAQVFKHGYFHYCSIVPKNISSTISNKCELFIIFLSEVPDTSFIGFRIKVSKETFIDESNSLLLFLKKLKKPVFYLMNNNCIHVQCGENAWELFYLLYAAYLRQFVVTVIGTQFFYNFVYSFCIQREIQLLELLFKGSKIIRISKKSIYYKIHRKRKISLSNLIHMTLNMPQSKRCIISFNSKVSLLHSSIDSENFYTCSGSKIHVSKLVLKKFKNQITDSVHDNAATNTVAAVKGSTLFYPLEILDSKIVENTPDFKNTYALVSSSTSKRKLEEIENDSNNTYPGPTSSKFLKISESLCRTGLKDQWELFTGIKPYTITSYSSIPCLKHYVPNLINNGKPSHINKSDSYLCNANNHDSVKNHDVVPSILSEKNDANNEYLKVQKGSAANVNICSTTKTDFNFESSLSLKGNTSGKLIHVHVSAECSTQTSVNSNQKTSESEKQESLHSYNVKSSSGDIKNSPSLPANFDEYNINTSDDVNFITAAGKNINFSNNAFLKARRLMEDVCDDENQQDLPLKNNFESKKKRLKRQSIASNNELCRKYGTGNAHSVKTPDVRSCNVINLKDIETASKNLEIDLSENTHGNFQSDSTGNNDSNVFSTAAGKNIKLSNAALQAAQKLMQDAIQDESGITPTGNYSKHKKTICKNSSAFRDIGFSLKKSVAEEMDVGMDKILVEKFFEDTGFDEKELTPTLESNKDSNVNLIIEPRSDKNIPVRKPRKSLGGRRNMRFCSDAL